MELAAAEISINSINSSLFVGYITDFIALNKNALDVVPSVGRLGWFGNEFIPFDGNYAYDGFTGNEEQFNAVRCEGELEKWVAECNRCRENPVVRMTLDASLASPLLEKLKAQMFIVHLWGTTEAGKSVAMLLALSAWGDSETLFQTFNATQVGMERLASFFKHLPLALDELQTIKDGSNKTDKIIYNICGGKSRVRGNKLGGNDTPQTWKNILITTGEQPLTEDSSGGGAKNRSIELHCERKLFQDVQQTLSILRENFGSPGKKFIDEFVKVGIADGSIEKAYRYICAELSKYNFTDKQRNSIAVMCLADAGYNVLFRDMELAEAIVNALNFYRIHADMFTDKEEIKIGNRSYDDFVSWVDMNRNKFDKCSLNDIYGIIKDGYVFILPTALDKFCKEFGVSKKAILAEWREKFWLCVGSSKEYRVCERLFEGQPRSKCYKVKLPN